MKKTIRRQAKETQEKIESFRHLRGIDRRVHFERGGDLASWRGIKQVEIDRMKEDSKNGCRGTYVMDEDEVFNEEGPDDDWSNHLGEE